MNQPPSTVFAAVSGVFPSGLGDVGVRIRDHVTLADVVARTPTGVVEDPLEDVAGVSLYRKADLVSPAGLGAYDIVWDSGETPPRWSYEDLQVTYALDDPALLSPRALCTLQEAKEYYNPDDLDDTSKDNLFVRLINAGSREFYRVAQREFVAINAVRPPTSLDVTVAAQARTFDGSGVDVDTGEIEIGDLTSVASVTVEDVAVADADRTSLPRVREPWQPITALRLPQTVVSRSSELVVTGVWGFPAIPEDVRQRVIELVKYWADRDKIEPPSEMYMAANVIPAGAQRSLPTWAYDTAVSYRRSSRLVSLRVARG